MANILLGVTGSVAAIRAPALYNLLQRDGHDVKIVATSAATFFFDPSVIAPLIVHHTATRNPNIVILDEDEWPGRSQGGRFSLGDPVLHIELRRWADVLVVAPLDANSLSKMAVGIADNCLMCVWRAWDLSRPVILAPAMNTLMWEHPLTRRHLQQLAELMGASNTPADISLNDLILWINENCATLEIVAPQTKRLACGDIGVGALAEVDEVARVVNRRLKMKSHDRS